MIFAQRLQITSKYQNTVQNGWDNKVIEYLKWPIMVRIIESMQPELD